MPRAAIVGGMTGRDSVCDRERRLPEGAAPGGRHGVPGR